MQGRFAVSAIATFALFALFAVGSGAEAGSDYLDIREVTMLLDGGNATFELNYTLDPFTKLYVMALGCRYLEPELLGFLGGYSRVKLVKADTQGAALQVIGAGKYNSGYFLFDSTPFGSRDNSRPDAVARFSVVYPEGRMRTFYNVTSTQNVFSQGNKPAHRQTSVSSGGHKYSLIPQKARTK